MRKALWLGVFGCLAACSTMYEPAGKRASSSCPAIDNRNWHAWIDRMPGPGATTTLNISGEVDLPTPGYELRLRAGPADRMMPPGQRFALEWQAPQGIVTQVITATQVTYREPTPYSSLRSVTISCGGKELATIPDVMLTE